MKGEISMKYKYRNVYQKELTPEQAAAGVVSHTVTYGIFQTLRAAKFAAIERGFSDPMIADCVSMYILNSDNGRIVWNMGK